MALSDPQVVTIATVANTLPRTSSGVDSGAFTKDTGDVKLSVSYSLKGKRNRRQVRLDITQISADPLLAGVNVVNTMSAYLVLDTPKGGFTSTQVKDNAAGLIGWLSVSGNLAKFVGSEN